MSKEQEPFFFSSLECPVCKTVNDYENIRNGSYTESGRDKDFKPTGRVWQNPAYQKYDPLLFFMATCKKCFYTREFNKDYKNWQSDSSFKTYRQKNIQQKHLSELSQKDGIVRFLGTYVAKDKYPFESAVIKFLLGIYDAKFSGRPSNLDLGRYFLRIAWLFRDQGESAGSNESGAGGFLRQLKGAAQTVNQIVPSYDQKVNNLKKMMDKDFSMVFSEVPEASEHKKQIEQAIAEITNSFGPLSQASSKLMSLFNDAEKSLMGKDAASIENAFHQFSSFTDFLTKAREKWEEIPLNEIDAMEKAAEYYQKAYETGGEISQGIQQVQAAYLIAELYRRIGKRDDSSQFFNQTLKLGREIVMGKKGDQSTVNFTKNLLDMAMEQARLNKKEAVGDTQ